MPKEIKMPKLGESVVEGVIGKWLKAEGEFIDEDEPLVEVDTDKVNAEVPSTARGIVHRLLAPEGATVAVGQVIAIIRGEDEVISGENGGDIVAEPTESSPHDAQAVPGGALANGESDLQRVSRSAHLYSPAVRRLALESGIDPATVVGTGLGGRVSKKDMEQAIAERAARPGPAEPEQVAALAERPIAEGDEVLPITRMRRTIAERMVQSTRHGATRMDDCRGRRDFTRRMARADQRRLSSA